MPKFPVKTIALTVAGVVATSFILSTVDSNDAGYRTVLQSPSGELTVKFDAGWYIKGLDKSTVYGDYLTYDYTAADKRCDFNQSDGVRVRYQDGGEGSVCGVARVKLPNDESQMIALHKTYRSEGGIRAKMLDQKIPKALNLTAALMTSGEAYGSKRSEFIRMSLEQAKDGAYKTVLTTKTKKVGIDQDGNDEYQTVEVPVIQTSNGIPLTEGSAFTEYGIQLSQFDIKAWDFEDKTLTQIEEKRAAEMATVTAKANAKKAYWQKEQVIADGEKNVKQAEYDARKAAQVDIVNAERNKQTAVIKAQQQVSVNEQAKLAAAEDLETAKLEAKAVTVRAKAEADAKEMVINADGALDKKLAAMVKIEQVWANAYSQRQVPKITMGAGSNETNTDVNMFQSMLNARLADQLLINPKVTK